MRRLLISATMVAMVGCGRPSTTPGKGAASGVAQTGQGTAAVSEAVKR